jgi:hypothetical protein
MRLAMQPSLQAPASVNATLALPSLPLCSSRLRTALPSGLALANFAMESDPAGQLDAPLVGPS